MRNLSISMNHDLTLSSLRKMGFVLILSAVCSAAVAVPADLKDQHGKVGGMDDFSGKPVVVFVTSLTKMAELGKWEEAIRAPLPDITTMDIGDIDTSSSFILKELDKKLEQKVPSGVRVYLDEKNTWAKEYSLDLSKPCALIFDADHKLVDKFCGDPQGPLLDQVVTATAKYFPQKDPADAGH